MAFDFPSSPAEGQIFNAPGGPSYVFNTPVWKAVGQGQIAIISDTPPASPANGALWYESDSGVLYIWYNDGNSSQWVQVGGVMQPPPVEASGTFKITSGSGGAGLATAVDLALPTGYNYFDLHVSEFQPVAAAALFGVFSWDGGATFPLVTNSYGYVWMNAGSINAGPSDAKSTVVNCLIFGSTQGLGAAKKGQYRIWLPVVEAGTRASVQWQSDIWAGTEYRTQSGMSFFQGTPSGSPNALRLFVSGTTFSVNLKWQLNGVK